MTSSALPTSWIGVLPWLSAGVVVWVLGWLAAERLWLRRHPGFGQSASETWLSLAVFATVGGSASLVAVAMQPLLALVHPHRLGTLSMGSPWHWLLAWTVTDLAYYGIHRALHETRLGWAFHAPHHTTPQLTMPDALRSSWGEQPMGVLAYGVPLVLLGVPPLLAGHFYVLVAVYQLVLHTEMPLSLGPLDGFVYTPAAHRLHHSRVRAEADSNYGGFFVLFDRMFGTWRPQAPDARPAAYGLPRPTQPTAFADVVLGEGRRLLAGLARRPGLRSRLRYAFAREDA